MRNKYNNPTFFDFGAGQNVQSDWDTTDTTSDSYILNKPTQITDFSGTLPVNQGGTGATTLPSGQVLLGNGTNPITSVSNLPIAKGGTGGATATAARTNLEVMKSTTLYSNSSGTQSTVTLPYTSNNYEKLEIYYRDNSNVGGSIVISKSEYGYQHYIDTFKVASQANNSWKKSVHVLISGSSITFDSTDSAQVSFRTTPAVEISISMNIWITKIIGYSY